MSANGVVSDAKASMLVGEVEHHVYPRAILQGPSLVGIAGALLEERLGDLVVDVLLLEMVLVLDRDLAVEVLQPGSLAEAEELVMNEAVLHTIQLVDILHDGQTFRREGDVY